MSDPLSITQDGRLLRIAFVREGCGVAVREPPDDENSGSRSPARDAASATAWPSSWRGRMRRRMRCC